MDFNFLEELGLSEEQSKVIKDKYNEYKLEEELTIAGVKSLSAAKGIIENGKLGGDTAEQTVTALKEQYPYLFEQADPVFSGPAGGETENEDEEIRRALGL